MDQTYIRSLIADRLGGETYGTSTEIYKFEKIKRAKKAHNEKYPDRKLLDFGVGEPDKRPNQKIIDKLYESAKELPKHGYTDTGTDDFRAAASGFMADLFGVSKLDPKKNILPTIGSKEALANFPKCLINPGDVTIQTIPGYPILATNTKYLGGEVFNLILKAKNNYLPDFSEIPDEIKQKAKILYLNYPNNPTGKNANEEFLMRAIDFAKKNKIVIAYDGAYAPLVYGKKPLSVLNMPGGRDVAIEFHSFSKSFSMTGWRLGFVCGNELLIDLLTNIKDNTDSGSFEAIQKAGIYAMENYQEFVGEINERYQRRLKLLVESLNQLGFEAKMPEGTFFLFVKAPKGIKDGPRFENAEVAAKWLIEEKGIVTVPWDESGEPHLRFSATFQAETAEDEEEQMRELLHRLKEAEFRF